MRREKRRRYRENKKARDAAGITSPDQSGYGSKMNPFSQNEKKDSTFDPQASRSLKFSNNSTDFPRFPNLSGPIKTSPKAPRQRERPPRKRKANNDASAPINKNDNFHGRDAGTSNFRGNSSNANHNRGSSGSLNYNKGNSNSNFRPSSHDNPGNSNRSSRIKNDGMSNNSNVGRSNDPWSHQNFNSGANKNTGPNNRNSGPNNRNSGSNNRNPEFNNRNPVPNKNIPNTIANNLGITESLLEDESLSARQLKRRRGKHARLAELQNNGQQNKESMTAVGKHSSLETTDLPKVQNESIKAAVVPLDYPNIMLDEEQMKQVQNYVIDKIDSRVIGPKPCFNDCIIVSDCLIFDCFNKLTRLWLKEILETSPIEDIPLKLMDARQVSGYGKVSIYIPEKNVDSATVLKRIQNQNDCLKTGKWKVFHSEADEKGLTIFANVDKVSLRRIKMVDCKLGYKFSRVAVDILGEVEGCLEEEENNDSDIEMTESEPPIVVLSDSETPRKQTKTTSLATNECIEIEEDEIAGKVRHIWICP